MTKTISELFAGLPGDILGDPMTPVTDISFDSRQIIAGAAYIALRGLRQDGHDFAAAAVAAGAKTIIVDKPISVPGAVTVRVPDTMEALKQLSVRFWDRPSRHLMTIGITGTNGKTTTSYLLESILEAAGMKTGVLGTISYRFQNQVRPAPNTTPFPSDLQRFLSQVHQQGGHACVMEVSSHALALGRVEGVDFDVAVFTNLTQDHLDFHKTMEAYAAAKARLFASLDPASAKKPRPAAVINLDDSWVETMRRSSRVPVITYSLKGPSDIYVRDLHCDASGSRFRLHVKNECIEMVSPLLGDYNVSNTLAAAGAAFSQGISLDVIKQGLERCSGVPGRMERVDAGQPFTVVVDYAHTDDALRQVLTTLRKLKPRRLLTVFGCGGDRDRTKRPLMGESAARLSDEVFVTSDNPRSEDPAAIALDVEVGVRRVRTDHYVTLINREDAIRQALQSAGPGDIVLIAGKGHETYQIIGRETFPFDDRAVARGILESLHS